MQSLRLALRARRSRGRSKAQRAERSALLKCWVRDSLLYSWTDRDVSGEDAWRTWRVTRARASLV